MTVLDSSTALLALGPAVARRLPAVLTEVGDELAEQQHTDYAYFLRTELDGIAVAARDFVDRMICSSTGPFPQIALFEEIGRVHHREGREIAALLAAYRIGAAVAWRHITEAAVELAIPAGSFAGLAGTVFAAVDQLSAASLRGYAAERCDDLAERERTKVELAELLLSDRSDSAGVAAAAARARWPLPGAASVVLVDAGDDGARAALGRLGPSTLVARRGDILVAVLADPGGPGRAAHLRSVLGSARAVIGPTTTVDELPAGLRLAELALPLRCGDLAGAEPLFVADHLDALLVHRDPAVLAALQRHVLAPLDALPAPARERLTETLKAWLRHMGVRQAVATELHVHPQTVRYRLGRLREVFGDRLDDPAARSALLLALEWGPARHGS